MNDPGSPCSESHAMNSRSAGGTSSRRSAAASAGASKADLNNASCGRAVMTAEDASKHRAGASHGNHGAACPECPAGGCCRPRSGQPRTWRMARLAQAPCHGTHRRHLTRPRFGRDGRPPDTRGINCERSRRGRLAEILIAPPHASAPGASASVLPDHPPLLPAPIPAAPGRGDQQRVPVLPDRRGVALRCRSASPPSSAPPPRRLQSCATVSAPSSSSAQPSEGAPGDRKLRSKTD